jgi:hypothetical protein
MKFIAADSVFAVHDQPHGRKPLLKGNWRIFKYGADLERKLLLGMIAIAAIEPCVCEIGHILGIAVRAADFAIKPANGNHELTAVLRITEELDGLLKCFWAFHERNVAANP